MGREQSGDCRSTFHRNNELMTEYPTLIEPVVKELIQLEEDPVVKVTEEPTEEPVVKGVTQLCN